MKWRTKEKCRQKAPWVGRHPDIRQKIHWIDQCILNTKSLTLKSTFNFQQNWDTYFELSPPNMKNENDIWNRTKRFIWMIFIFWWMEIKTLLFIKKLHKFHLLFIIFHISTWVRVGQATTCCHVDGQIWKEEINLESAYLPSAYA